jgi:hypothetical protein
MESKIDLALNLLNQIIEKNLYDDYKKHEGKKSGVDWNVFHLNTLKELIMEIKNER